MEESARKKEEENPEEGRKNNGTVLPATSGGKIDAYKYPGGGRTFLGCFQRVKIEGRRGRGYWEWKRAEMEKRASAEEADDELTSFESDTLKKLASSPPPSKGHVTFQQDPNYESQKRPETTLDSYGSKIQTAPREQGRGVSAGGSRASPLYLPHQDITGGHTQSPSHEEAKSPVERITISSFSQPRLTPLLNRAQPPKEPPSCSPSPPSGNTPTAPPKEMLYADSVGRRAARSEPVVGQEHQSRGSSEPSKYSGVKQVPYSGWARREPQEIKGPSERAKINTDDDYRQYNRNEKLEWEYKARSRSGNESEVPTVPVAGTKISTSTYTGHSESSLNTSRHDNTLSSIPSLNSSKNYIDFEPESKPLLLLHSDDEVNKGRKESKPPVGASIRIDRASSLVPLRQPTQASSGAGSSRANDRRSGALVWVSQPGGGAKLEWVPTPGLSTLRATPATPQGSLRGNPSSQSQQQRDRASHDSAGVAASKTQQGFTPKGIIKRGDEGGGGGGSGGRRLGGGNEDARERGNYLARVASDDPRAVGDGLASRSGPGFNRPNDYSGGNSSQDSSFDAIVAVPGQNAPPEPHSPFSSTGYSKNVRSSAPGVTRPAGRTYSPSAEDRTQFYPSPKRDQDFFPKDEEDKVVTVAGRTQGQTVRIRIRPEVHAYLSTLPVIRGCLGAQKPPGPTSTERRDSIHSANSSSASGLTLGSGEGSTGYQEQDYEAVIDEYTLLKKAVDDHDPEALRLLTATEAALCPEGGGGSEYPYLREMKERLLISKEDPVMDDPSHPDNQLLEVHQTPVGTVVRLNADGYGSHTSPTHRVESLYTGTLESRKTRAFEFFPKNAKTSTFITLSLLYATLLVVVCLGFVLSEVLTHNVPLYYYEAFFTYLYGLSIFFLLYVFCYLLTDSSREPSAPNNQVYMVRRTSLPFQLKSCLKLLIFFTLP